jgi:3-oxoacyl-[acyl-carrier protein] reductase
VFESTFTATVKNKMNRLADKVAIVTGGSRGIGAAIGKRLAKDGATVVVNYSRNAESADRVVAEIQATGGKAVAVQADISDLAAIEKLFAKNLELHGKLDILVNNAGLSELRAIEKVDAAFYESLFNVNVRAPLFAIQAAVRSMGAGGRIVNITSSITKNPNPEASVYAGTKAALETITRSLANEFGSRQITVNAVGPGVVSTDMLDSMISPEWQQSLIDNTPLGRLGKPEDIADVVAFLASDDARWITGEIISANGGL